MRDERKKPTKYHYRECGLDNVWIEGGFEYIESPYGSGVVIQDMDGLHKCIGEALVMKPGNLSGQEFRFLRTELDLSQFAMGALCGRGERTVRDWETGAGQVEEPANTIIRVVYEQRTKPNVSTSYEEVSKLVQMLQTLDKKWHELKLKKAADGWKSNVEAPCLAA